MPARVNLCLALRWQPHATRPDQARIGRLKTPDRPANCSFHVNVLVIRATKRKVRTCGIAVRQWYVTEDHAARIIFDNSADAEHGPEVAVHVVVDAIGPPGAGIIAPSSRPAERRV
jgi:hypothetical protein